MMLKIVPDPPNPQSLEDTLMMASDYALCAEAVAHQAALMQPRSPAALLIMTTVHELEGLRKLIESALTQLQMRTDQQVLH